MPEGGPIEAQNCLATQPIPSVPNENESGPFCDSYVCYRHCKDGIQASPPAMVILIFTEFYSQTFKVICKKSENGYSWVDPDNGPLSESILGSCSVEGSPDVVKPDDGKPDLGNSGDDKPNWGNWDKDKPDLDNSDDTKPDSGNWDEDKPDWSTPADDKPDDNKPDGGSWDWDKSDEDRPDSDNSDGDKTDGWSIWDWSIWNWGDSDKDKQDWDNSVEDKPDDGKQDWTIWDWGNSDKDKADWEKPADWEDGKWNDGKWNDGKWGDEDWEKPKDESEVETKPAAECPLIETDPNEAATGPKCDIYHGYHICKRDCNQGFRPMQPFAVNLLMKEFFPK